MNYESHQKSIIADFNQLPETIFLQNMLDIRSSGTEVLVPDRYTHMIQTPTKRAPHYNLTRMLLEYPLLPASPDLTSPMRGLIEELDEQAPYSDEFDNYHLMKIDTSFWPVALALNRGASKLYRWEHNLYRVVLNEYLVKLQDVLMQCHDHVLTSVNKAFMYIPSLSYLLLPLRFWLGGDGSNIYGHETIFYNYIEANFPMIYFYLFRGGDVTLTMRINPFIVEYTINGYACIKNELERNIVHDPATPVPPSYKEGDYHIYWWFPKPLATMLGKLVIESKTDVPSPIVVVRDEATLPSVEDVIENVDSCDSHVGVSDTKMF